jgi:uncharacterized LabA/DUF88 family protein
MDNIEQIAVFVDVENLIGFCNELQLPIDLADVLEKLKDEGRITVRRSFGDITKALAATNQSREADNVRRMLRDNLFFHEDIPYMTQFKNSADMRLAVEALYTAFTLPSISKFAIVSGDSDYVPLFLKLKEQNKSVIGITGSDRRTAVIYRRACDSLFYFEEISRASMAPIEPESPSVAELNSDVAEIAREDHEDHIRAEQQMLKDEYASLLVRAVQVLNQSGRTASVASLQMQMRQLRADFDIERAGFTVFSDLVAYATDRNMVRVTSANGDTAISLPGQASPGEQKQSISTAQYRMYLQERIKCQLPPSELRNAICEQAFAQIGYSVDDGGILLRDLSHDVTDELAMKNINVPQPAIYKYLYSLHRARCFTTSPSEYGDFNPMITGFRAQKQEWDDHFVGSQVKLMANETSFPMYPDKLSLLFYETEGKSMQVKQLLNSLGIKFEVS